ncbi:nuclear transport factor 2 family protein [Shewanella gelidimarina]|uniref:nuclear transport factor 2 family protein n=1 Tax=Shewanella gelidimarina TaxID=56813 RepID=UPI00200BCEAB|nr:nuclear transport factor 2 family protein [Shewanella gelidimarina]MCL1059045.1 nuclear transport factor 2 family protein [Shewanella gelidimarina]
MFNLHHRTSTVWRAALLTLLLFGFNAVAQTSSQNDDKQQAAALLNHLNIYSANADWDNYFDLYADNGIFIGTDVNEHWDKATFEQYARPTKGWRYDLTSRVMTQHGEVIWFDEILNSASYGVSRGTGTLIKTAQGWKIAQYHLSFPIPNDIAKSITMQIIAADAP